MDGARDGYQGDRHLASLLAAARIAHPVAWVRDLAAGVEAAPAGIEPDCWFDLIGPGIGGELADALRALRASLARPDDRPDQAGRLAALRAELARQGLAGFMVPRADEHQGEYVPACARRLAWLTGFSGSAGVAVVLGDRAAIFVDGRYTIQVRAQVPAELYEYRHLTEEPHAEWVAAHLPAGGRLGYDPWLHTVGWVEQMRAAVEKAGGVLVAVDHNPVDAVWTDRPPQPLAPVAAHDLAHAGQSSEDKRDQLARQLAEAGVDAAVLTQPDSIAWLLNVRGGDVENTPLPLSFALAQSDGAVTWFVDRRKLEPGLGRHLGNRVEIRDPAAFGPALDALAGAGRRVRVDPATAAAWIFDRLAGAGGTIVAGADPCALPKARKNPVELAGCRSAHHRDGIAMVRFLHWLDERVLDEKAGAGELGEIEASDRLYAFRSTGALFQGMSFDTISGAGPNGAIVHYRATPETERRLVPGSLYLIDSGAQYRDGTTDITRTIAIGAPSEAMRRHATLVLKGHIALGTARFPKGTTGAQLDVLARRALWQHGLDYDHGTGHGVGSYLSVHEGPQRIAKAPNSIALEPGMILSNEPGYYRTGAYGIRIENLVVVRPCDDLPGAERPMLAFETLTLAPIDRRLIEVALLDADEVAWVDAYHARVRTALAPELEPEVRAWLAQATAPLGI